MKAATVFRYMMCFWFSDRRLLLFGDPRIGEDFAKKRSSSFQRLSYSINSCCVQATKELSLLIPLFGSLRLI